MLFTRIGRARAKQRLSVTSAIAEGTKLLEAKSICEQRHALEHKL